MRKIIKLLDLKVTAYHHPVLYNREMQFINSHPNDKMIFLIRDPRDLLVSMYDGNSEYPMSMRDEGITDSFFCVSAARIPQWEFMNRDERLMSMIKRTPNCALKSWYYLNTFAIARACRKRKNVTLVKYQELVGPKGGGDLDTQRKWFERLCEIADGDKSRIPHALAHVYGGTHTYNNSPREGGVRGQTGRWRLYFNQDHIAAFKHDPNWNRILLDFGFETSNNW